MKMMSLLCITVLFLILAGSANCETPSPHLIQTVKANVGEDVILPCRLQPSEIVDFDLLGMRVHWTKITDEDEPLDEDVLISLGLHKRTFGSFQYRVSLLDSSGEDASLKMTEVSINDFGRYRCEIISGEHEIVHNVYLEVESGLADGVVFPYSPNRGRYNLNFDDAIQACVSQDAAVASYEQLHQAWKEGLDWCNAGWLNDGTVQYPINKPREPCGGSKSNPGVRSYGRRDKKTRFDVFCYASELKGHIYWLVQPHRLTFDEAVRACIEDDATIAKVGQMYAAWKLEGYDRCDAGWLADGSVRYPISKPRKNCSPTEAAVRFVGFPNKKTKSYGVYCFKADE